MSRFVVVQVLLLLKASAAADHLRGAPDWVDANLRAMSDSTAAPTSSQTAASTSASTSASTPASTSAPTSASTSASTAAPTSASTSAPTSSSTHRPWRGACGLLTCAQDFVCCDEAPAALCGHPGSTCCYNPSKTIANICAPGWACNEATGYCDIQSNYTTVQCGALTCAAGATCCDQAPVAVCGAPGHKCCYKSGSMMAMICVEGTTCNNETGICKADFVEDAEEGAAYLLSMGLFLSMFR
uniref:Granulins domain-containing protein n=1 Tax=Alexandrium andersonii TaxID=327968 RepID=A0A7S2DY81_9DINO